RSGSRSGAGGVGGAPDTVRAAGQPAAGTGARGSAHGGVQPGATTRPALPAARPAQGRTWGGSATGDAALDDYLESRPARRRRADPVPADERVRWQLQL